MKKIESPTAPQLAQPSRELPWVLYVEDEEDNWIVTELQLRRRFHLTWARDDRDAFELLHQASRPLHAILMDIQLRGARMDGIQLTRALRGTAPAAELPEYARGMAPISAPIIFVTAYGARYSKDELLAAGGHRTWGAPSSRPRRHSHATARQAMCQESKRGCASARGFTCPAPSPMTRGLRCRSSASRKPAM